MKVGASTTNFRDVKAAFESVYAGMGITCADVGGLWFDAQDSYYEGMEPCTGATVSTMSSAGYQMEMAVSFCVTALALFSL